MLGNTLKKKLPCKIVKNILKMQQCKEDHDKLNYMVCLMNVHCTSRVNQTAQRILGFIRKPPNSTIQLFWQQDLWKSCYVHIKD